MEDKSGSDSFLTEDEIKEALRSVALGTAKRSHEVQKSFEDDGIGGSKREHLKEAYVDPPNVSLLMKLMENRIGGPQDYC